MMARLYGSFLSGKITDSPLTDSATTINSPAFADLPTIAAPDTMMLTLDMDGIDGAPEWVEVTTHTASATSVTVTRGALGSIARQHETNMPWNAPFSHEDGGRLTDWTIYTPTWTATGTNPTVGDGSVDGRWKLSGEGLMVVEIAVTFGAVTLVGTGNYRFSLPANWELDDGWYSATRHPVGTIWASEAGVNTGHGITVIDPTDTTNLSGYYGDPTASAELSATSEAWGSGDEIVIQATLGVLET